MNDDLLDRIALLDPIQAADASEDARTMAEVVDARIEAAPAPPASARLLRSRRLQALLAACLAIVLVAVALASLGGGGNPPAGQTTYGWIVVGQLQDLRSAEVTYVERPTRS